MQIKVDKHQLYELAKTLIDMPPEGETEIREEPNKRGYFLLWNGELCWAYLAKRKDSALLIARTPSKRNARGLFMDELRARGLVKEE